MIFLFFWFLFSLLNEVFGDNGATNHHHHHCLCHQLQTVLTQVLDRIQKKEIHPDMYNFQDDGHIGSGPGVQVGHVE